MELLPGDIFLSDDDSIEARIVKFLMISPTIWHWILLKEIVRCLRFAQGYAMRPVSLRARGVPWTHLSQFVI